MNKKFYVGFAIVLFAAIGAATILGVRALAQDGGPGVCEFGDHNLDGMYEFHADGVLEVAGLPTRGTWEVGRFYADGQGNMTNGVEYSSLLTSADESIIDVPFTFSGTYHVFPDGTAKSHVSVYVPAAGITIEKSLWFVIYDLDERGIAHGFAGGHADADLGGGAHGNSRTHVGRRMNSSPQR